MNQMKMLDFDPDLFTTNPNKGWIHLKGRMDLFHMSITQLNQETPTIFIIPTGFIDKFKKTHPRIHLVNYSSHSSYSELKEFVKAVRPKKLLFSSFKKDYKYENQLIKHYCQDKSSFDFEKDFIDPLGIQTKISKFYKKAPSLKSSQTTVTDKWNQNNASQEEVKIAPVKQEDQGLLKPRKFTDIAGIRKNVRMTRAVARGVQFKHDNLVEQLQDLEKIKKRKKVTSDGQGLKRSLSREALSLYSEHSLRSMSSKRGLMLRDGKEVSSTSHSERIIKNSASKERNTNLDHFLSQQREVIHTDIMHHFGRKVKIEASQKETMSPEKGTSSLQQQDIRIFFRKK